MAPLILKSNPMSSSSIPNRLPTHAQLIEFFTTILPPGPQDVPLQYHVPRWPGYDPSAMVVQDIVLSIAPTPETYARLSQLARGRQKAAAFLHRPFALDRAALPRGSLVLASHGRFDERMTVGWNPAVAARLGVATARARILCGYKGDPARCVGMVGPLDAPQRLGALRDRVRSEFGVADLHLGGEGGGSAGAYVTTVAIMNALGPEVVARVIQTAQDCGFTESGKGANVLYVTGEPRDIGLKAASALHMPVICVGHDAAEEWGVRHIAELLGASFTALRVHTVFEDEKTGSSEPEQSKLKNSDSTK
jgi:putative NIF3 family GTP cyclohydrolase 1 type 2